MDGAPSPTKSIAAARALYDQLKRQRDEQIAERAAAAARGEIQEPEPLMRLRLTRDAAGRDVVDLSKADRDCERCDGTGRRDDKVVVGDDGQEQRIPVICMCVHRNGGVARDMLDRMLEQQQTKH